MKPHGARRRAVAAATNQAACQSRCGQSKPLVIMRIFQRAQGRARPTTLVRCAAQSCVKLHRILVSAIEAA